MLDWYRDSQRADVITEVIWDLDAFWWWRGHRLEIIARAEATIDALGDDHLYLSRIHAMLANLKANLGFEGILAHAERSAEHAELAGIPTPVQAVAARGTYFVTFGGDSGRALEQSRLATAAARAIGNDYLAAHHRVTTLTYTAMLAPGTDETLRLADDVRDEVEQVGSIALWQMWLRAVAPARCQ
jgi:hypothetical protein